MSQELSTLVKTDYARKSFLEKCGLQFIDEVFYPFINEKRDVMFVHWLFVLSALMIPLGVYMCFHFTYLLGAIYLALILKFLGVYILMLHCTSHSPLFKKQFWYLNQYATVILGNFFGQSPFTYYMHHMKMHHVEGNMPKDLSSTMAFQRDSMVDFLKYFGRFLFLGWFDLATYFIKKEQYQYAGMALGGEFSYHTVGIFLFRYDARVGFFLYLIPFLISRFGMMSGNWVQHAFVDQAQPNNDYMSSITCIDTPYNWLCFNDGYHTSHHLHPRRHWTEHPGHLVERENDYHKNAAVIFKGLDYLQIWYYLMTKNYSTLADHFVQLKGDTKPKEEIISLLKDRLKKFEKL